MKPTVDGKCGTQRQITSLLSLAYLQAYIYLLSSESRRIYSRCFMISKCLVCHFTEHVNKEKTSAVAQIGKNSLKTGERESKNGFESSSKDDLASLWNVHC